MLVFHRQMALMTNISGDGELKLFCCHGNHKRPSVTSSCPTRAWRRHRQVREVKVAERSLSVGSVTTLNYYHCRFCERHFIHHCIHHNHTHTQMRGLQKRGHNVCRIYKKAQINKDLSLVEFHNVYKDSLHSTAHKSERFFKGVWGMSLPLPLMAVVDCR